MTLSPLATSLRAHGSLSYCRYFYIYLVDNNTSASIRKEFHLAIRHLAINSYDSWKGRGGEGAGKEGSVGNWGTGTVEGAFTFAFLPLSIKMPYANKAPLF